MPVCVTHYKTVHGDNQYLYLWILCLAQSPGLPVAQKIESSAAKGSRRQQILRKSKTQVKKNKKNPSFQQFCTVLGCKPSPYTGLGVRIEMMHSKDVISKRDFHVQCQCWPRASWESNLERLAEGVMLRSASSLGAMVMVAAEGRFFFSSQIFRFLDQKELFRITQSNSQIFQIVLVRRET